MHFLIFLYERMMMIINEKKNIYLVYFRTIILLFVHVYLYTKLAHADLFLAKLGKLLKI